MTIRYPARAVTVEFRAVLVTIERDYSLGGGLSVSMRHRRATAKRPVALRGDEAAFLDAIRTLFAAGVDVEQEDAR